MPEATIDDDGNFVCGICTWFSKNDSICIIHPDVVFIACESLLDDLYAVLHARHMAQHYDSELIARIEKAVESVKEDELYGGE